MKNTAIGILLIASVGALAFGFIQNSKLAELRITCESEKGMLEKLAQEQQLQAKEFQAMAALAQQEAMIQRTLCEEQLNALKSR